MFFTSISQIMTESIDLTLVIRKTNGQLTVSALPKANGLKDEAQNHIIPLTLSGSPEEMDAGFLHAIAQPLRKATGLISNMMEFEMQTDKAAANSKSAKEAKSKETKEEKEKREKYEKHMKKAEELAKAQNHKDAIASLQQARMFATADKHSTIDAKIEEQKKAMNKGSLFDMVDDTPEPQQQPIRQMPSQTPQTMMQQRTVRQAQPQYGGQPQYAVPQQGGYPQQNTARQQSSYPQNGIPMFPVQEQPYMAEDTGPAYINDDIPSYRPEDYDEYPDFPQHMLESNYPQTYASTL